MDLTGFLNELITAPGVSGGETCVADIVERHFRKHTDDVWRDPMGSIFCRIGKGKPVLMLMAHMDEIGMMVQRIEDNGTLRLAPIGGVDPRTLPGSEVQVYGREVCRGIIGAAPEEKAGKKRDYAYGIEDLVCDLGMSAEQVKDRVSAGDFVTFDNVPLLRLQDGFFSGKTMDDRALVAALCETLEMLSRVSLNCTVVFAASVQEERGCLGAGPAARGVEPDLAVAADVGHAPIAGARPEDVLQTDKLGFETGGNIHPGVFRLLTEAAENLRIAYEVKATMGHTGTDAWNIQNQMGGIPTGVLSVPLKYMHTSVETLSIETLHNAARLLTEMAVRLDDTWEANLCWND